MDLSEMRGDPWSRCERGAEYFGRGAHGISLWRDGKTDKGLGLRGRDSVKEESSTFGYGEGQLEA